MNPIPHTTKKYLIAANWKMNTLPSECQALVVAITDIEWPKHVEVLICPPFTHLHHLQNFRKDGILLGAQNCHDKSSGAYTGEISAEMLVNLQCDYVILGHSERRAMYPNENIQIHSKIKSAIDAGLQTIYCCGESKETREHGNEMTFIAQQLKKDLFELSPDSINNLSIAYEPIWAIGTGKHASPEQAQSMHEFIRKTMATNFNVEAMKNLRILYGGSVNATNVESLSKMPDIDGVLVGGASLIPCEFKSIIKAFSYA